MKKIILTCCILFFGFKMQAQFVAKVMLNDTIAGICNHDEIYSLFSSLSGQVQAKCSLSDEEIQNRLNEQLTFLKANPKYKSEGSVSLYINCKGEVVKWENFLKSKNKELDEQILAFFSTLKTWSPGKLNGKNVDCIKSFNYKIKKGILILN